MKKGSFLFVACFAFLSSRSQNIGIRMPPTSAKLSILGDFGEVLRIEGSKPYVSFYETTTAQYKGFIWSDNVGLKFASVANEPLYLSANYENPLTIMPGGWVGIGNTNPSYPVDVNGRVAIRNAGLHSAVYFVNKDGLVDARAGMIADNIFGWYSGNTPFWSVQASAITGNIGIGTTPATAKLKVSAPANTALEMQGAITVYGPTPAAFDLTVNASNQTDLDAEGNFQGLWVDHPACNNDPQALLFVTPKVFAFQEFILVKYDPAAARWKIIVNPAVQSRMQGLDYNNVNWRGCALPCLNVGRVVLNPSDVRGFIPNDVFSILVIKR